MELEKDEHVILDDGTLGFRKKLTLTNQRLIVQKGKGFFKVSWKKEEEIPLEEIEEVYAHVDSFPPMSVMKLTLKNGRTKDIRFKLPDSGMVWASLGDSGNVIPMNVKSITDRWVHAINDARRGKE